MEYIQVLVLEQTSVWFWQICGMKLRRDGVAVLRCGFLDWEEGGSLFLLFRNSKEIPLSPLAPSTLAWAMSHLCDGQKKWCELGRISHPSCIQKMGFPFKIWNFKFPIRSQVLWNKRTKTQLLFKLFITTILTNWWRSDEADPFKGSCPHRPMHSVPLT